MTIAIRITGVCHLIVGFLIFQKLFEVLINNLFVRQGTRHGAAEDSGRGAVAFTGAPGKKNAAAPHKTQRPIRFRLSEHFTFRMPPVLSSCFIFPKTFAFKKTFIFTKAFAFKKSQGRRPLSPTPLGPLCQKMAHGTFPVPRPIPFTRFLPLWNLLRNKQT